MDESTGQDLAAFTNYMNKTAWPLFVLLTSILPQTFYSTLQGGLVENSAPQ